MSGPEEGSLFDQLESSEQVLAEDRLLKDLNAQKGWLNDSEDGMLEALDTFGGLYGTVSDPHSQLPRVQFFLEGELGVEDYTAAMEKLQLGRDRSITQKVMSHRSLDWFGDVVVNGDDMVEELRNATTAELVEFGSIETNMNILALNLDEDQYREATGLIRTASEFKGEHVNVSPHGEAPALSETDVQGSLFDRLDEHGKAMADANLLSDLNAQKGWLNDSEDGMMQAVTDFVALWGAVQDPATHLKLSTEFLKAQLSATDFDETLQNMQTGNSRTLAQKIGACVYLDWKNTEQRDTETMLAELRAASPEEREAFAADPASMEMINSNLGGEEFKEAMLILGTAETFGKENTGREPDPGILSNIVNSVTEFEFDWTKAGEAILNTPEAIYDMRKKVELGVEGVVLGLGIGFTEAAFMFDNYMWGDMTGDVDTKAMDEATKEIPPYHVIMEQLAHRYAYSPGASCEHLGYKAEQVIFNPETDFQAVWFSPTEDAMPISEGQPARDVVAFRGTDKIPGWLDDSNTEGVGAFQWSMSEGDIAAMLASANANGKADVCGHSLGGALAQRAACVYGSMVGDVVTFQSPGLNADEFDQMDPEHKHESTHYRRQGDWVHGAGEQWTDGDVVTMGHVGWNVGMAHTEYPLAEVNSIRGIEGNEDYIPGLEEEYRAPMLDSVKEEDVNDQNYYDQAWNVGSEWRRKNAGGVISADKSASARAWQAARAVIVEEAGKTDTNELITRVHDMLAESTADQPDHTKTLQEQATKLIHQFEGQAHTEAQNKAEAMEANANLNMNGIT